MKKIFKNFILVAMALSVSFEAFAKKDVEEKSLGPENSWQESFDINEKKPGKYNVLVTAEDNAGNQSVEGPFNIWIDPESDLPVVSITNPVENMRVPGNLNIVGTCIDDDAVESVCLILDGDEDNLKIAEGKDFWSFYIDTNNMLEGPHTIEVFGTDINGLSGHHARVMWQLDRRAPVVNAPVVSK